MRCSCLFGIGQHPPPFPHLEGMDIECGQLLPAQGVDAHLIPLALEPRPVGNGQQLLRLLPCQPVSLGGLIARNVAAFLRSDPRSNVLSR